MKIFSKYIIFIIIVSLSWSCEKLIMDDAVADKPTETFEYLWKEVDQHYSFFDYKQIDWKSVHDKYKPMVNDNLNEYQFFNLMFDMLSELKDGHVNLIAPFNISRYEFDLKGKNNYNERLIKDHYISSKYYITGPFMHDFIQKGSVNIGYIRYDSFMNDVSPYSMDFVLARYHNTDGIILDIRQNGGGSISNIFRILEHFVESETPLYQSYIKIGPGHQEFSEAQTAKIQPDGVFYYVDKPIMVLVDRGSFSASSFFSLATKAIPNIHLVGDTTGGGLGAPSGGQLPNGWTYRFSVTKTLSLAGENFENGVPPDHYAILNDFDVIDGKDAIIDKAVDLILHP